jgi:hypothetical protein
MKKKIYIYIYIYFTSIEKEIFGMLYFNVTRK